MKKMLLPLITITALAALLAAPAFGNYLWTNAAADNDWRNPLNWSASGTSWKVSLDGADRAIINPGDPLSLNRNVNIGDVEAGGDGEVIINGSTISFERYLRIGASSGLTGTLTMTDGTINAGRAVNIGQSGATGIFHFSGGTINANVLQSGDTIRVADTDATAVLNMSGSATINLPTANAEIGEGTNSVATVSISDNASLNLGRSARVGFGVDSTATINISGGSMNALTGFIGFGQGAGSNVTVTMSGGEINADRLGFANNETATATLDMTGGVINLERNTGTASHAGGLRMQSAGATLNVGGDAVINAQKLYISDGGLLTVSGEAQINISGSVDGANPTLDIVGAYILDDWSTVLGNIVFNGGSLRIAGAADPVSGVNYVDLLTAAIAEDVITTDVAEVVLIAEYVAGPPLPVLQIAPAGTDLTIAWDQPAGQVAQLQYNSDLGTVWVPTGIFETADDPESLDYTDTTWAPPGPRFYRLSGGYTHLVLEPAIAM